MPSAIACSGLTKRYGDIPAVEGLDLVVEPGQVFGFLGPNGAGKTTTIRLILDLIRPTAGSVRVLGEDPAGILICADESATCPASWRCMSR